MRGIEVYAPWQSERHAFLAYLVTLDGWDVPHFELDRIDVNGGYAPGNLRFVTKRQNVNNRRTLAALEVTIKELRNEIEQLHARIRHYECGTA